MTQQRLEPVPGAAQPDQMCEKLWTLPSRCGYQRDDQRQRAHHHVLPVVIFLFRAYSANLFCK
jgi:hypothetical protein